MKNAQKAIIMCVVAALGTTACQMEAPSQAGTNNVTNADKKVVEVHVDFPAYKNAEELCRAADAAIIGELKESHQEILNIAAEGEAEYYPYTIYTFDVKDTIKGTAGEGDSFSVKILGGTMEGENYVTPEVESIEMEMGKQYFIAASTYEDTYASPLNYTQAIAAYSSGEDSVRIAGESYHVSDLQKYASVR